MIFRYETGIESVNRCATIGDVFDYLFKRNIQHGACNLAIKSFRTDIRKEPWVKKYNKVTKGWWGHTPFEVISGEPDPKAQKAKVVVALNLRLKILRKELALENVQA